MQMENFAPVMFAGLVLIMLIGFPVAFSLAALGLGSGFLAIYMGWFHVSFLSNLPLNMFGILSNELLLAIPFFTFMGAILEKCGLAEDMLDSMGQLFGPARGGLGYSVIIVGFILGAITGTVAGQVIAMAMISLPVMIRYGYNMRYATGVLAASGTITQLVPPSLVLIVMADQLGRSVGDMYKGAWGPSILQVLIFAGYTFMLGVFKPHHVPGVPKTERTLNGWALWGKCLRGIIPSAILIFAVLGSMGGLPGINTAIATPTEAGAMGVVGALILAAIHKRLTAALIWEAMIGTMRLTAMVVFILIGARVFSMVFQGVDGAKWVEHMLSGLPGGQTGFLIAVNIFIFFLAFFLDFFEIAFIILPMLGPVADKLGIDLIWFGVLLCVNMQTSFMHPPFGFALFYLRGIADTLFKEKRIPVAIKSNDIYLGAIPWVAMQLILVTIVIFVPQTVTIFLDKAQVIDINKVKIDIPVDESVAPPTERSAEEEQKRIDELFKTK
ncbi:MAG: C4-dicarboxylate ABC transporter [Polaromonas sp. 39-63-203]|jgi:tripartite ATP-independent transporter DctM subunit|uniref:TRAP transporter large permease n=1 Tax=Polaromonas sp. TaxID=1869339 RepID=UPI000BDC7987|nr:TRAP transporter large permease subunit [Polaromonas sp.]OYY51362.1 MAG: C4-dicarboxylate ABC transporter [Polaromonas sp. 35-63-240]OYY91288.1 MAG: C4-dicarboxylate ABC transporter [Polaromonas sp. 28-63-22]OYZ83146.1 MAG: C4-dicarboxylate ABC transporter [Polaromonas sp. 24-62-144]OZA95263.1 MAG: C4-dicarboxylate ABC transporter [Polaromonas sp. 39-63-203]HQS31077.1 TRAP transporter large permease subunit [Polaromonas sp.]